MKLGTHVIVSTEYRGVYYGTLAELDPDSRVCRLDNARMAVRWGTEYGIDQLAQSGPTDRGIYAAEAPSVILWGLTHIAKCSSDAQAAWDALPQQGRKP